MNTGVFPKSLKLAKVIPIHKAEDKQNVSNYRPISILPLLSKIFEKIVFKQMLNYLDKFSLLSNNQYGFRPLRSTTQAILDNLQYIYSSLDSDHIVLSFFLDFSKAFDCIDHKILLSKLNLYGFRGVTNKWFESYLSDRSQFVCINDVNSEPTDITHGVPQGSILGPILFLLFINDFPDSSDFFKFTLFADDSNLLCRFKNFDPNYIYSHVCLKLKSVYEWLMANKIKINVTKCKFIIFSYGRKITLPSVLFGDGHISETNSIKFLGLIIDKSLNLSDHLKMLKSKLSRSIGILYKLNKFLPQNILKLLFETLIKPDLTYGVEAWYYAPNYITDKLFIIQK